MSDFLSLLITPEAAAVGLVFAILGLACYLMYIGVNGMIKRESILTSIFKFIGGLVLCISFMGGSVYFIKKKIK